MKKLEPAIMGKGWKAGDPHEKIKIWNQWDLSKVANPLYFYRKSGGSYKIIEPSLLNVAKFCQELVLIC